MFHNTKLMVIEQTGLLTLFTSGSDNVELKMLEHLMWQMKIKNRNQKDNRCLLAEEEFLTALITGMAMLQLHFGKSKI